MKVDLIHLQKVTSTNIFLKDLYTEEPVKEGTTVWADFQLAGRGQKGNVWESERAKNLLFSTIIYPIFVEINQQFVISQIASLAVKKTLDKYVDNISIKWPNDVYYKDRKICGMLIENNLQDDLIASSILGIGINLNQTQFVDNSERAISLKQITGKDYDREEVLNEFLKHLFDFYQELKVNKQAVINNYKKNLYRKSGYFDFRDKGGNFKAQIKNITGEGYLILETDGGDIKSYAFKEVQFI